MTSLKLATVFATMDRALTAVSCVRALASQTRPPELMVVADNVSSDDTMAALTNLTDLPFELMIHRMAENRCNAGGVEEAMELAFANGADAVWILETIRGHVRMRSRHCSKNPGMENPCVMHCSSTDPPTVSHGRS